MFCGNTFLCYCKPCGSPQVLKNSIFHQANLLNFCGRVLQALAKDKLYPGLEMFGKGSGKNDDPVRGYIFVFCVAVICILIGDLNIVSGLLSNFFIASYGLINFSSFHASITKSPGWRPSFRFFNPWLSLLGTISFNCIKPIEK